MDEAQLTACVFQKMLDTVFLTEHNMARQLGLSYKVLRRVQTAQRMTRRPPMPWSDCCNTVCAIRSHWIATSRNIVNKKAPPVTENTLSQGGLFSL